MIDEELLKANIVRLLESFDLYTKGSHEFVTVQQFRDIVVPKIIEKSKVKEDNA